MVLIIIKIIRDRFLISP